MSAFALALLTLIPQAARADWTPASTFSPQNQYVDTPQVAANSSGDAAIAWSNYIDPYNSSLQVEVRHASGSFSDAQTVSDGQPGQNTEPSISVAPDGTVAVVWTQNTQAGDLIRVSYGSSAGGSFTPPATVEGPEPGQGLHHPTVSFDSGGGLLIVWAPLDGGIHYASRAAGASGLGPVGRLANPGSPYVFNPVFAIGPRGDAVAAWADYKHIYAATRAPGGPFTAAQTVLSGCQLGPLYAAVDGRGDGVVDWTSTNSACDGGVNPTWVKAAFRPAGQPFGSVETVAQMGPWAWAGGAAMSSTGIATVACLGNMTSPTSASGVTAVTRGGPGGWSSAQPVTSQTAVNDPPALSYDSAGNLWAAWDTRTTSPTDGHPISGVFAAEHPAGGSFSGQPTALQQADGALDLAPVMTGAGDGAIAIWATGLVNQYFRGQTASYLTSAPGQNQPATGAANQPPAPGSASASPAPTDQTTVSVQPGSGSARHGGRWRLAVAGRARQARRAIVRLVRKGRVIARARSRVRAGRYLAELVLPRHLRGRYTIQIVLLTSHGRRMVMRHVRLT